MDFMNFMSQINNNCGAGCGNCGCDNNNSNNGIGTYGSGLLPLLLLSGLGQNSNQRSGGNMVCYPNSQPQPQQFVTPTSIPCCDSGLKYRTKRVRQAYMEVPVATYQVAQPYYYPQAPAPTTMNVVPVGGGNNSGNGSFDLWTLFLLLFLANRCNSGSNGQRPQPRGCGSCATAEL